MIQSAGRSRLLELRRDLATARDGRGLLDRKREAILRAVGERLPILAEARRACAEALDEARALLAQAQLQAGRTAIDAAALAQPSIGDVGASDASVAGIPLVVLHAPVHRFVPRYGPASAPATVDEAGRRFTLVVPDLLTLASHEDAVRRLRRALARTVRRLNALDAIVIPELAREIHRVASALEEEERDEAVRRNLWWAGRMHTP